MKALGVFLSYVNPIFHGVKMIFTVAQYQEFPQLSYHTLVAYSLAVTDLAFFSLVFPPL